jgi:hypothetical protein
VPPTYWTYSGKVGSSEAKLDQNSKPAVNKVSKLCLGWGSISLKIFKMRIPVKSSDYTQANVEYIHIIMLQFLKTCNYRGSQ